jgi:ribonuclease P protein component
MAQRAKRLGRMGLPLGIGKRADFVRVQGVGRRFKGRLVVLLVDPRQGPARVGYTVSRRVGNAVQRNKVRRRLKEIVRLHATQLRDGYAHVLIAFPTAATVDYATLQAEVLCLLQRAGVQASLPSSCSP